MHKMTISPISVNSLGEILASDNGAITLYNPSAANTSNSKNMPSIAGEWNKLHQVIQQPYQGGNNSQNAYFCDPMAIDPATKKPSVINASSLTTGNWLQFSPSIVFRYQYYYILDYVQNNPINDLGEIIGTATYTPTGPSDPIQPGSHGVLLVPVSLKNLADPYQGSTVIGTQSHKNQDTAIQFKYADSDTNINSVAWIAASDPAPNGSPRMPHLEAKIGISGDPNLNISGSSTNMVVYWKLSVINHGTHGISGAPYRDFDTGTYLQPAQVAQLTNVYKQSGPITGAVNDDVDIPFPTKGSSDPNDGWRRIPAPSAVPVTGKYYTGDGSTWDIFNDPDWLTAVSQGFFGGDAILSVKITQADGQTVVMPQTDFKFRIAGENPTAATCQAYINGMYNGPTENWTGSDPTKFNGYWFAYAIAKAETDGDGGRTYYNQFLDNGGQYSPVHGKEGTPDWNNDGSTKFPESGSGGYGLFQLTFASNEPNFIMPRDWIWNWQTNVQQFLPSIQSEKTYTASYLAYIKAHNASYLDPSALTTTQDQTTFNFWESSVITIYNFAPIPPATVGSNLGAWAFTPGQPAKWRYIQNKNSYLLKVAEKGVEGHP